MDLNADMSSSGKLRSRFCALNARLIRYVEIQVPLFDVCAALIFRGIYRTMRSGVRRVDNRRITLLGFESDEN